MAQMARIPHNHYSRCVLHYLSRKSTRYFKVKCIHNLQVHRLRLLQVNLLSFLFVLFSFSFFLLSLFFFLFCSSFFVLSSLSFLLSCSISIEHWLNIVTRISSGSHVRCSHESPTSLWVATVQLIQFHSWVIGSSWCRHNGHGNGHGNYSNDDLIWYSGFRTT